MWNKPLVRLSSRSIPAELAILSLEIRSGEKGAWLNSRKSDSGVVDLACRVRNRKARYYSLRENLPKFVSKKIMEIFRLAKLEKGCPDLVMWNMESLRLRFIEVKCPRWDKLTKEQQQFMRVAKLNGISVKIVEWEFNERGTVHMDPRKKSQRGPLKSSTSEKRS